MPKRGDRSHINGCTRVLLLAILDDRPLLCISVFFWTEMLYMLKHGSSYVIYAPYIQKIINSKTDMEFQYDGDHGARTWSFSMMETMVLLCHSLSGLHIPLLLLLLLLPVHLFLLLVDMHPLQLLSPPELLLVRARNKISLLRYSRLSSPCVAPTTPLSESLISR
jgi:hypothetical protein